MLPVFRKMRWRLARDNQFYKYTRYAIGEIVLVVIGILIALQINNWNEERIQERELNDLMNSVSNAIASDIRNLKLIRTARENTRLQVDSIYYTYIINKKDPLGFNDFAYVANAIGGITNTVFFQPRTSAFESLKNSIYLSKLQGTDIEILLNSYYSFAEQIQKMEEEHNRAINTAQRDFLQEFRNKGLDTFTRPYFIPHSELTKFTDRFYEILRDPVTESIIGLGYYEGAVINVYDRQIGLGEKFISMVQGKEKYLDEQAKLDFSGILYSHTETGRLRLMINGRATAGFDILYAASESPLEWYKLEEDYIVLFYPENTFDWASPYISIEELNGRVSEMDFSKFRQVKLEMRGDQGGEEFFLIMKDKYDPPDGTESRVPIKLTDQWETYEVDLSRFETADKKIISVPLGFVFLGDKGFKIHVRSIQFE